MSQQVPLLAQLESFVRLTSYREKTISANMANVDTPGYHTVDIDFQGELNRAMRASAGSERNSAGGMEMEPVAREVPGLVERADGNNVDLDRQALVMSEVQLQYQLGIQLIKDQFHQILSAINEES
ncbi:MAG TPA: flagellar basal body rod protein FlgB [Terracidiphilus sp.]|nr:flagellar basal body rod protein FlgB [Terracidiphilus sp.]